METQQPNNKNKSPWMWAAVAAGGIAVVVCICVIFGLLAIFVLGFSSFSTITSSGAVTVTEIAQPVPTYMPPTLAPSATDPATGEPTAPAGSFVGDEITAELPERDRYVLADRYLGIDDPAPVETEQYEVGDVENFWVSNDDTEETVSVPAELAYMNERVYMWIEQGVDYDIDAVRESADRFSDVTYPTNIEYFGSKWDDGIDNDPRIHILHSTELGFGVAGYFYSPSEYPANIVPYSNEKEIFFININNTPPGSFSYDSVLAHEFQHMIHWQVDKNEESWMNEGMSEVAAFLNGFGPSDFAPSFLLEPDLQLTDWPEGGSAYASYGGGFLFNAYFLDRFGEEGLRALVANPVNGMESVDETLAQLGEGVTADEVFTDWTVANLLNDPTAADGQYGYADIPDLVGVGIETSIDSYPYAARDWQSVHQYGTDYITLDEPGTLTFGFEGAQQVQVIPTDVSDTDDDPSTADHYVWWSNRGDESNMTLSHPVDLTGVDDATLSYDVWYWIEEEWDYGYVNVSTDGGETWETLATPHTTTVDPHGNLYGEGGGYTGQSAAQSGADADGWLHEEIDLSAYAGQEILIGFEMITDDAVNQPGMAVDNICVDAIDWCDYVEEGTEGWDADGFVRISNVLPQVFSIQAVVTRGNGTVEVTPVTLDAANIGTLSLTLNGRDEAVLVISGLTRHTTERAFYRYSISEN